MNWFHDCDIHACQPVMSLRLQVLKLEKTLEFSLWVSLCRRCCAILSFSPSRGPSKSDLWTERRTWKGHLHVGYGKGNLLDRVRVQVSRNRKLLLVLHFQEMAKIRMRTSSLLRFIATKNVKFDSASSCWSNSTASSLVASGLRQTPALMSPTRARTRPCSTLALRAGSQSAWGPPTYWVRALLGRWMSLSAT